VLGIIGTGFAYLLNYQIITSDGATAASMVTYLLPVVAIVLGVLVLDEGVIATMLAGIALVLTGSSPDTQTTEHTTSEVPGKQ
jgi:drug/metabolite transporter (DMT)-like permease